MRGKSGTRAIKNAKFIRAVSPHLFPKGEPQAGYASVVPFAVLDRFDRMTDEELRPYPQLRKAATILRRKQQASRRRASSKLRRFLQRVLGWVFTFPPFKGKNQAGGATPYGWWGSIIGWLFGSPPFTGTLYFLKLTFTVGDTVVALSEQDMATIVYYTSNALRGIAAYTSQYGASPITVSTYIVEQPVNLPSGMYSDDDLLDWVQPAAQTVLASGDSNFCIIVCNPEGVVNTDATAATDTDGYHHQTEIVSRHIPYDFPYIFVNVHGTGPSLTVRDEIELYATGLSHEIAEMIMDPEARPWANPEVCDPCEGEGIFSPSPPWKAYFQVTAPDGNLRYLGSAQSVSEVKDTYDFYISAIVQPLYTGEDNAPAWGCDYGPDYRTGTNQLLFYERASGSSEIYAVDSAGNLELQTIQLRETEQTQNNVSLIVRGQFMSRSFAYDPVGEMDLFLYSPLDKNYTDMNGAGRFFQVGLLGEINPKDIETGLQTTWSIIVAGKFSDRATASGATNDLLFYDPTLGVGAFYSTNNGLDQNFANTSGWRTTWSIIVAGKFSASAAAPGGTDDLFFYDPTGGVGEFYHTNNGFDDYSFSSNTGLRTAYSIIVAGKFSASAAAPGGTDDVFFYDPTGGVGVSSPANTGLDDSLFHNPAGGLGVFYHTNTGLDDSSFAFSTGLRTTWSMIIVGKFSASAAASGGTDDVLFYDPTTGEGEFYHTNYGLGELFATASGWRTTWSNIVALMSYQS